MLSELLAGGCAGAAVLLSGRGDPATRLRLAIRRSPGGGIRWSPGDGMQRDGTAGGGIRRSPGDGMQRDGTAGGSAVGMLARAADRLAPRTARPTLDVAELAERLAALAEAGLAWSRVWAVLAEDAGPAGALCGRVSRHLTAGGGTAEALRAAPGPTELAWLAVACDLSERAGAPLADVLRRFAAAVRADTTAAADREAALAGPRATATLLSWLPLGGLGLAALLGADPVTVLLGTGPGRACLVVASALWVGGRRWSRALVRRAEAAGDGGGRRARVTRAGWPGRARTPGAAPSAAVHRPAGPLARGFAEVRMGTVRVRTVRTGTVRLGTVRLGTVRAGTVLAGLTAAGWSLLAVAGPDAFVAGLAAACAVVVARRPDAGHRLRGCLTPRAVADRSKPPPQGRPVPGPVVIDLVAATVEAGTAPGLAVHLVALCLADIGDPAADALHRPGPQSLSDPPFGPPPGPTPGPTPGPLSGPWQPLFAALELADSCGLGPVGLLRSAAAEQRRRRAHAQSLAAHRLAVLAVLPLSLCLLPAFVLVTVVPLVLGLLAA